MRYANAFSYHRYKRTVKLSNGVRLKDSTRQRMESLSVEAYELRIARPPLLDQQPTAQGSTMMHAGGAAAAFGVGGGSSSPTRSGSPLRPGSPLRHVVRGATQHASSSASAAAAFAVQAAATDDDGAADDVPGFSQGLIATAACFLLRQTPADSASSMQAQQRCSVDEAAVGAPLPVDPVSLTRTPCVCVCICVCMCTHGP